MGKKVAVCTVAAMCTSTVKPTRETAPSAYSSIFEIHPTREHHIHRRKANIDAIPSLSGSSRPVVSGFEPRANLNPLISLTITNTQLNSNIPTNNKSITIVRPL